MGSCTKICSVAVAPKVGLFEPGSTGARVWSSFVAEVARTKGFRSMCYGYCLDDPSVLQWLIDFQYKTFQASQLTKNTLLDWDDMQDAFEFNTNKSPAHASIYEQLKPMIQGSMTVYHVNFAPRLPDVATSATITEMIMLYFPASIEQEDEEKHWDVFKSFRKVAENNTDGLVDLVGGWAVENVKYEGVDVKVFVALLGWDARIETQIEHRHNQTFRDALSLFHGSAKGSETHYFRTVN